MKPSVCSLFTVTVLCLFALPQIGIDLYLPSLPDIQSYFMSTQLLTQSSISIYIFSMGLAQLLYGPLSDHWGRKRVVLIGTCIFLLGSVVVALSHSMFFFLFGRLVQGAGMGAGFTVASAMLADEFSGTELARVSTYSSMVYSSSPLFAPVLGGYIAHYFQWQLNFVLMAVLSFLLFCLIIGCVHSSYRPKKQQSFRVSDTIHDYFPIIANVPFIAYTLITTLVFGITIVFNVVGPFLLQEVLHVSAKNYGLLLFVLGAAYLLGTALNSILLKYFSLTRLMWVGSMLMLLGCVGFLISGLAAWFTVWSVTFWSAFIIFATGWVWPNAFAKALGIFSENLGRVTAMIGAVGLVGTSLLSVLVGYCHIEGENPLAVVFLLMTLCVMGLMFLVKRVDA